MKKKVPSFPIVVQIDRLSARKVRVYFTDGARIIDGGLAVKFGAGPLSEVSAWTLREREGRVLARAANAPKLFPGQVYAYA